MHFAKKANFFHDGITKFGMKIGNFDEKIVVFHHNLANFKQKKGIFTKKNHGYFRSKSS